MNFTELKLLPELVSKCESLLYTKPTPIQTQAIPVILSGADLIGCAETGSGKTAAFMLPIVQQLSRNKSNSHIRVLIIAPTRELALQIESAYHHFALPETGRCIAIIGGASMQRQREALRRGAGLVIATPGRLLDHFERGSLDLANVEVLVLDEADRMLDMGFWPTIRRLLDELPKTRQTLLFSATMSATIEKVARSTMRKPSLVEVNRRGRAPRTISHFAYPVAVESKTALLLALLEEEGEPFKRVLIFTRTRRGAERLSHILEARQHSVGRIHAERTQPQREAALRDFKSGQIRVMVATDVAARGIDVTAVSHVINYDVPLAPEDYVHRVGRSGRAGTTGHAITLMTPADASSILDIERLMGHPLERVVMPTFSGFQNRSEHMHSVPVVTRLTSGRGLRSFRPRRASRR